MVCGERQKLTFLYLLVILSLSMWIHQLKHWNLVFILFWFLFSWKRAEPNSFSSATTLLSHTHISKWHINYFILNHNHIEQYFTSDWWFCGIFFVDAVALIGNLFLIGSKFQHWRCALWGDWVVRAVQIFLSQHNCWELLILTICKNNKVETKWLTLSFHICSSDHSCCYACLLRSIVASFFHK